MIVGMIEHLLINVKVTKEESVVGGGGGALAVGDLVVITFPQ